MGGGNGGGNGGGGHGYVFLAGALSGLAEGVTIQPLEMLKTRFQINEGARMRMLPALRGYVSLGYRWNDWTFYGLVGRILAEKRPVFAPDAQAVLGPFIGPEGAAQAQVALDAAAMAGNSYRHDQSSVALGMRWELASRVALKLQVDRTKVHAYGAGQWQSDGSSAGANNLVTSLNIEKTA